MKSSNSAVNPLSITVQILGAHASAEAAEELVAAACGRFGLTAGMAAEALMNRRSQLSMLEAVRQSDRLHADACRSFAKNPDRFLAALKQCFHGKNSQDHLAALRFIQRTGNPTQFSDMIALLQSDEPEISAEAGVAVVNLAELVERRIRTGDDSILEGVDRDAVMKLRLQMLNLLNSVTAEFGELTSPRAAIEAILILGDITDEAVTNATDKREDACRQLVAEVLMTSKREAVLRLICRAMLRPYPVPQFYDAMRKREDSEFVESFLGWLIDCPHHRISCHLSRMGSLPWLRPSHPAIINLPKPLHAGLAMLVRMMGDSLPQHRAIQSWVVRNSDAAGRAAAQDVLNTLNSEEVQEVLYEALDDHDPQVEAWAIHQLRNQKVPDAFAHLLKRLDTADEVVREAAREQLSEFNLSVVLELFPRLPASTSRKCGELLQKLDSTTAEQLRAELCHPWRWKRIRAIHAADALGMIDDLEDSLIDLLANDDDAMVRRTAIEVLCKYPSPQITDAIQKCVSDSSRNVRDSAFRAVDHILSREQEMMPSKVSV